MAVSGKKFWASEPVTGPAGKYHVEVERLAPGQHPLGRRDLYTATLYRKAEDGNEAVETAFWQHTSPPHDADKFVFRDKARKAAAEPEESATAE